MNFKTAILGVTAATFMSTAAFADMSVTGGDQDVSGGSVTASSIKADADGWLVVHRTADGAKPGPVIGHAAVKKGDNSDVSAKLGEPVKPGEKLMLMLHGEAGGKKAGEFEYTLGSKLDGPVKKDGKLVMSIVTAK